MDRHHRIQSHLIMGRATPLTDSVRIQAGLTQRDIGIVAVREQIDTREGSVSAKFFRRSMLAQGAYQVDSASERIKLGLDRARAGGKHGHRH